MNIKQALKEKGKLIKKIGENFNKVQLNNTVELGVERPYDPIKSMEDWKASINDLIELKTNIHRANAKVYDKIFRLAELKSMTKQLKQLSCQTGKVSSYRSTEPTIMESAISLVQRDAMIEEYEKEIESLQDFLDSHNAKTKI